MSTWLRRVSWLLLYTAGRRRAIGALVVLPIKKVK